jgi:glycosyltransferase involved in cell wall biosynthesis
MDHQDVIRTYGNPNLPEGTPERPLVTFSVFAYNQEKYVREAVDGAFAQTYSPLEIILSDDCSSDRTFEIMEQMARVYQGPHKILLRRGVKNLGIAAHVNEIFRLAAGKFIVVAAGDDVSYPERVAHLINVWRHTNVSAIYSAATVIDASGKVLSNVLSLTPVDVVRKYHAGNRRIVPSHYGAGAGYEKELFVKYGPIPENLRNEDLFLAVCAFCEKGIAYTTKPLISYRRHSGNIFSHQTRALEKGVSRLERKRLDAIDFGLPNLEELRKLVQRRRLKLSWKGRLELHRQIYQTRVRVLFLGVFIALAKALTNTRERRGSGQL